LCNFGDTVTRLQGEVADRERDVRRLQRDLNKAREQRDKWRERLKARRLR
jgi:FtsZ-binding cell division protein ZapB